MTFFQTKQSPQVPSWRISGIWYTPPMLKKFLALTICLLAFEFSWAGSCQDDEKSVSKNLSQLFRSDAKGYWSWVEKNRDLFGDFYDYRGFVMGDAHPGNIGPIAINGRAKIRVIDLDDGAPDSSFIADYAHLAIAIGVSLEQAICKEEKVKESKCHQEFHKKLGDVFKETNREIFKEMNHAYLQGLLSVKTLNSSRRKKLVFSSPEIDSLLMSDKEEIKIDDLNLTVQVLPQFVFDFLPEITDPEEVKKYVSKRVSGNEINKEKCEIIDPESIDMTNQSQARMDVDQALLEAGYKPSLDIKEKIKEHGGNLGVRLWALTEEISTNEKAIVEFKEYFGSEVFPRQSNQTDNLLQELRQTREWYLGPSKNFGEKIIDNKVFLLRPRIEKIETPFDELKALKEIAVYDAFFMGVAHALSDFNHQRGKYVDFVIENGNELEERVEKVYTPQREILFQRFEDL